MTRDHSTTRRLATAWMAVLTLSVLLVGCASDPTASEEYRQLEDEKAELEDQAASLQSELDDALATVDERSTALDASADRLTTAQDQLAEARQELEAERDAWEDELAAWVEFTGSANDEPYLWNAELFDATVRTCTADGTDESDCVCLVEGFETEITLMDLLLIAEINAQAALGVVDLHPETGLPVDLPGDLLGSITGIAFDCFTDAVDA